MAKQKNFCSIGKIRIIGGQWRGRKLPVIGNPSLRPTTERIRETLFNWLAPVIRGARCLDCFAGSGALGLEALSRYAASVTLLEQDRAVSAQIFKILKLLQVQEEAQVINTTSLKWLSKPGDTYDVVFIDPPFRQGMINKTIKLLKQYRRLTPGAWIYVEMEAQGPTLSIPACWQVYREKLAGQVICRLYLCKANSINNPEYKVTFTPIKNIKNLSSVFSN